MSENFDINQQIENANEGNQKESIERVSVPSLQVKKFKNVLLYILERCAGKPNVGETVLYKLLYFSDFNYYELYEEQLTGALNKTYDNVYKENEEEFQWTQINPSCLLAYLGIRGYANLSGVPAKTATKNAVS